MKQINKKKKWETPVLTVLTSVEVNETVLVLSGGQLKKKDSDDTYGV